MSNFDKGNAVCAVFFDLSKAANNVGRNILLNKLECCGVRGNMLILTSLYLVARKQFVSFGGYKRPMKKV